MYYPQAPQHLVKEPPLLLQLHPHSLGLCPSSCSFSSPSSVPSSSGLRFASYVLQSFGGELMCHPLPLDHLLQVLEAAELLGIDIDIHVVDPNNANEVLDPRLDHNEELPSIGSGLQSAPPNLPVKEEMLSEDLKPGMIKDPSTKPLYKCPSAGCDFKTKEKGYMRKHNETKHQGVRFDCNLCDYQTPFKKSLGKHIVTKHPSVSPFPWPCDVTSECNFKGLDMNELTLHKKRKHNKDLKANMASGEEEILPTRTEIISNPLAIESTVEAVNINI